MNTLEERLERSGYTKRLADNERDMRLVENARREFELSGNALPPEMLEFEKAVIDEAAALAAEYESTVRIVDTRNDLEFALLQTQEQLELAAEQLERTDPEQAAKIRSVFGDLNDATARMTDDCQKEIARFLEK
ncbi:MAG: hypothetical protein IPG67_17895 [Acidobacteria bacterium]|nr:hypothetical protein [Acidobacteriota bacterium]